MKASQFISTLTDLDPDYVGVPDGVDLSEVEIVLIGRSGSGYTYPDGIYYDRGRARFEELTTATEVNL